MAIFSYRMGDRVSRGAGQSAVKVAAYQARENLRDARTGYAYNHQPRECAGIAAASAYIDRGAGYDAGRKPALFVGLYAPSGAPDWCRGRENIEQFWSKAELAERRSDAQIAERIIIALPHELSLRQNIWLLQDHVKEFTREGRVVQVAIHEPEHGDRRNIHAHLLVSTRGVDANGFKASKAAEQQSRHLYRRQYVTGLRAKWAEATNRHLARHGYDSRIDHRTLKEQGIEREPTIHLGPGDSRRELHGERSAAGEVNREIAVRNAAREAGKSPEPRAREQVREAHEAHEREREQPRPRPQPPAATVISLAAAKAEHEAAEGREMPPEASTGSALKAVEGAPPASDSREDRSFFGRASSMIRSAFEATLDWIAPRVADPHDPGLREPVAQAPLQPRPAPGEQRQDPAQKSWEEQLRELAEWHRKIGYAVPERREAEHDSPFYERYKAEREAVYQAREAAEREVRAQFAAYAQDLRGFYNLRFEQEKASGMPGPVRHDAMQLLAAMRRGDRATAYQLEHDRIAEVRRAHSLPDWGGWLKREAEKGDREAARALARHEAREAGRNRDRDDNGRGIEP